jgi:hypothetical protein
VIDDQAYIMLMYSGFVIVDFADKDDPILAGQYGQAHPYDGGGGIDAHGNYVYAAMEPAFGQGGLYIVDANLSGSTSTHIGFYDSPGSATNVTVSGRYAYVTDGEAGLRIVDISVPSHPVEVGYYNTSGSAEAVTVSGQYAYVADGESGLRVINIAAPSNLQEIGSFDTSGTAWDVIVVENLAYVADGQEGVRVIDVSTPSTPQEIGFYDTLGIVRGIAISGNYIYVADEDKLTILRLLRDKVTGSIDPSTGGSLSSTSRDTRFIFGGGAFTETVLFTYRHLLTDQDTGTLAGIGRTFDLTAIYSNTGQSAQLVPGASYTTTITYTTSGPAIEDTLGLYWWSDGTNGWWSKQGVTSSVNITDNVVTAQVDHLSLFAVLGETRRIYLPLVLRNY